MTQPVQSAAMPLLSGTGQNKVQPQGDEATQTRLRFEQMLWAEMLSHAGLEKAFTQGGGEGASAFSRYVVEAIAKDLAERHPLGLGEGISQPPPTAAPAVTEVPE